MGKNLKNKIYYTPKQYKNFSRIYFATGILFFLSALLFLSIGFVFATIVCILVCVFFFSKSKQFKKNSVENSVTKAKQEKNIQPGVFATEVQCENQIAQKCENHYVAGTSYKQNEILSLLSENGDYNLRKNDINLFDLSDGECEKIYKYEIEDFDATLQEEPDNEYDKNAIRVIIENVHVGYIKKGSCSHVKKLIANDSINKIRAKIRGGDYKVLSCEYDDDEDKDVYTVENEKSEFSIQLSLYIK